VTSEEAKRILAFYRPGDTETSDSRMSEALAQARKDPKLATWFGQHCAELAQLPPQAPVFKPEQVVKTLPPPPKPAVEGPVVKPASKRRLAVTILLVLAIAGIVIWHMTPSPPENSLTSYRDRMARLVQRSYPMKIAVTDPAQLRDYFRTNLADFPMPKGLEKFPARGAAVFTWHSQPVALMGLDAGQNTGLYLFAIKRSVFPNPPRGGTTDFLQVGNLMTAMWVSTNNAYIYMLAGPMDQTTMKGYLE
jgi:hypothetical protein